MRRVYLLILAVASFGQQTMFPPVRGTREMVGAANNFEVEAGFRILAAGGNAVDAGVASTLAAAVTEQARFGLGGEMPLIVGDELRVGLRGEALGKLECAAGLRVH